VAFIRSAAVLAVIFLAVLLVPLAAEVVYTPVNVSIPVGDSYYLDLNHDGVPDFTLRSQILRDYCQYGNGYAWNLSLTPAAGNAVVVAGGSYAAALLYGTPVGAGGNFAPSTAFLVELDWGGCGQGFYGDWLNLPNRYLGLQFRLNGGAEIHYGWAKLSEVGYVDQQGQLHTSTVVSGFAYETTPGTAILAGQTSGNLGDPSW
jgi:hypothetical protein